MAKVVMGDLDGVFVDFAEGFTRWCEERTGEKLTRERTSWWFPVSDWGWSERYARALIEEFGEAGGFRHLDPFPDRLEQFDRLRRAGLIVRFVTSRPKVAEGDTSAWLDEHFGGEYQLIVRPGSKVNDSYLAGIDDSPSQVRSMIESGLDQMFLLDIPETRSVTDLPRLASVTDFVNHVLSKLVSADV